MRPKLHVRVVTEQTKYLLEQVNIVEPVMDLIKDAIEKSKAWLEDKEGNLSTSYSEISQQLDQANVALLKAASEIIDQSSDKEYAGNSKTLPQRENEIKQVFDPTQPFYEQIDNLTSQYSQLINRFDKTEEELSSLKELTRKLEEKQNKMEKEMSDNEKNQEENYRLLKNKQVKLSKNSKNVEVRINTQEKRQEEINKIIEEIHSSYLEEVKKEISEARNCVSNMEKHIDLLTRNVYGKDLSIQDLSAQDKDSVMELFEKTREAFRKMDEQNTKSADNFKTRCEDLDKKISSQSKSLNTKLGAVCQILSTRIQPMESLADILKNRLTTRVADLKKMDELSEKLQVIASEQMNHPTVSFIASDGHIIGSHAVYKSIKRNIGNHFNLDTGVFTVPVDGLYAVGLKIKMKGVIVAAAVCIKTGNECLWTCFLNTEKYISVETTTVQRLKSGAILYSHSGNEDCIFTEFSCLLLGV
ncbi:putative autophagy-related protein 11 [Physella acuta]|uniref:putative autophagy-related protein 11 n=1 Tax=Physella acuta TaxID=109671 RepID=UPI0027DD468D|nr:putative autophagy-related protein 11 [Physella acuta]